MFSLDKVTSTCLSLQSNPQRAGKKKKIQVQFKLMGQLKHLAVSNDVISMALDNNHILRIDLAKPQDVEGTFCRGAAIFQCLNTP